MAVSWNTTYILLLLFFLKSKKSVKAKADACCFDVRSVFSLKDTKRKANSTSNSYAGAKSLSQQHIKIRLISHITSMFNTKPSRDTILILNLLMKKFPFSFTVQVEVFHYYLTTQQ